MNQTQNNTTGSLENTLSGTGVHAGSNDKLKAYAELTKVRISVMVMFTFAISAILAAQTLQKKAPQNFLQQHVLN